MWAHVFVRGYHRSVTFARTTIRGRLENKTLDDEPSSEGVDQIRACDQLRHAISLYRPCVSPLPSWRRNKKGEEEREKSVAKRHRRSPLYAPLRVYLARVCAREISCWSRSGCFHGERRVLRGSRKRQAKRNWTRRVTRAAILEKFRSRHSRSFLLLWEERTEREWKERERERERKGKKGKWRQLSYRRKLPSSVYPATIRSCVPSTHLYLVLIVLLLLLFFSFPLAFTSLFPSLFFLSSLFFLIGFPDVLPLADSAFPLWLLTGMRKSWEGFLPRPTSHSARSPFGSRRHFSSVHLLWIARQRGVWNILRADGRRKLRENCVKRKKEEKRKDLRWFVSCFLFREKSINRNVCERIECFRDSRYQSRSVFLFLREYPLAKERKWNNLSIPLRSLHSPRYNWKYLFEKYTFISIYCARGGRAFTPR